MKKIIYTAITLISFLIVIESCKSGHSKKSNPVEVADSIFMTDQSYSNLYTDSA